MKRFLRWIQIWSVAVIAMACLVGPKQAGAQSKPYGGRLSVSAGQRCTVDKALFRKSPRNILRCERSSGRLIWRRIPASKASKSQTSWNDLQIVFSRGGYAGQALMYSRLDSSYREFQGHTLVQGDPRYEISALDYHRWSKTLLFSIFNTVSKVHSVFKVSLGIRGALPILVSSGQFVLDGKIDIKSGDPLVLVAGSGLSGYRLLQYTSIGPIEIWNAQSAGWLSSSNALVFPDQILNGTGGENWVAGSTLSGQGWRIDRISNWNGRFYTSPYMAGPGELGGVARGDVGFSDVYWALATSTGFLLCRDPLLSSVFLPTAQNCRAVSALGASGSSANRRMTFVIDPGRKGATSLWDIESGSLINPETGGSIRIGLPNCAACDVGTVNVQETDLNLFPILSTWRILGDTSIG